MKHSRFLLVFKLYALWLIIFFLTRLSLLLMSWHNIPHSGNELFKIFTTSIVYDSGFFAYAMVLPVLYLCLVPEKIWVHCWHTYWLKWVTFVSIYTMCFIAVAEYFFWEEFSVRFNFISIDYLIYRREVTDNIVQSYPVFVIFPAIFFVALLIYYFIAPTIQTTLANHQPFGRRCVTTAILLLLPLSVFFVLSQDQRQISKNTYVNELASNGPYQFVAAFRNNELDFQQFYSHLPEEEANTLIRSEVAEPNSRFINRKPFDIRRKIHHQGPERKSNIILITVESLSSDFLSYFGNKRHLTPNLDALIKKSLFFDNFYATGTRTTRGLEAITLSIPPTPGRSIIKRIGRETDLWSLGSVLNTKGYHCYFLYGGRGYFENMNAFFSGNGYRIVDQTTVSDNDIHFSNAWGMADEDLYQQAIKVADRETGKKKPFFLHLMTTSNHRPYTYPDGKVDIPSGTGRAGAIKYTDYAIGQFLQQAQQKKWFSNTIFIIVADHQAGSAGKRALPIKRYHIPLWIYGPGQLKPEIISDLASQIDIAPTILGILNMSYFSCFFGHDILLSPPNRALIANYQNLGLFDGDQLAILKPRKKIALQTGFANKQIHKQSTEKSERLIQRNISYYQSAAYIYKYRINRWSSRNSLTTHKAAITNKNGIIPKRDNLHVESTHQ